MGTAHTEHLMGFILLCCRAGQYGYAPPPQPAAAAPLPMTTAQRQPQPPQATAAAPSTSPAAAGTPGTRGSGGGGEGIGEGGLGRIAMRRLQKELAEWQRNPPQGFRYNPSDNLQRWAASRTNMG